jgi:hypothetical protein
MPRVPNPLCHASLDHTDSRHHRLWLLLFPHAPSARWSGSLKSRFASIASTSDTLTSLQTQDSTPSQGYPRPAPKCARGHEGVSSLSCCFVEFHLHSKHVGVSSPSTPTLPSNASMWGLLALFFRRCLALGAREGSLPCSKCETTPVSSFSCR